MFFVLKTPETFPTTSNPVWSWISRKQVGLVTFTSVSQSPITSSPTRSSPRFDKHRTQRFARSRGGAW